MSKNTEYYNKFYRKWVSIWTYVDIETGEIIKKEEFKQEYKQINKEYERKYGKDYGYHKYTVTGRKKAKQLSIEW